MRFQLCSIKPDIEMICKMFNNASLLMNNSCLENTFYSRARWRAPVVPATREAEAGGSLEPRSSGL